MEIIGKKLDLFGSFMLATWLLKLCRTELPLGIRHVLEIPVDQLC